ncbi:hypothetical protein QNA08_11575 [Chelatococcus sp. SYSU_G07232]|uniref:Uncharacterized protein n=1 Tax=Chelatococcus albus TaxID=3047466 RepID=A0ABT7AJ81_9HYPH|nr:hypothetical protein [Chelatococcus sp. SYSU_G07232]MDJ1158874.1 hypothetical protein [Chelatococcus sp. SYSU_G07232]
MRRRLALLSILLMTAISFATLGRPPRLPEFRSGQAILEIVLRDGSGRFADHV